MMVPDYCNRYLVSRSNGYNLTSVQNGEWSYVHGVVCTPRGYVLVYSDDSITKLSMILEGYEVERVYRRYVSRRHIVTLAREFATQAAPAAASTKESA